MRPKPAGVIVSAILLVLLALLSLFGTLGSLLSAATFRTNPALTVSAPGQPAPSAALMVAMVTIFGMLYLAFSGWCVATSVGLFRMKNWARISAIVIGVLVALFNLFGVVIFAAMPALMKNVPLPAGSNPATLSIVFAVGAGFCLLFASVGLWGVIYFALRRTRDAFAGTPRSIPIPYQAYTSPMTDFTVAQPIEPAQPIVAQPAAAAEPPAATPANAWPAAPPVASATWQTPAAPAPAAPPKRPVVITVLAVLLLFGSAISLAQMLSPYPALLFGMMLKGMPGHVAMFVLGVATAYCGLGLLKLQRPAWIASFVLFGLYALNGAMMLLPGPRDRMAAYTISMEQSMPQPTLPNGTVAPNPALDPHMMSIMLAGGALFAVLLAAAFVVLLWMGRAPFLEKPAPTEQPAAE